MSGMWGMYFELLVTRGAGACLLKGKDYQATTPHRGDGRWLDHSARRHIQGDGESIHGGNGSIHLLIKII